MSNSEYKSITDKYLRLQYLLNDIAAEGLRKQFKEKWKSKYFTEWENLEENGTNFKNTFGANLYKEAGKIQKKVMDSGDIQKWDLPLLIDSLKCLENGVYKSKAPNKLNKHFDSLKDIRNKVAHLGSTHIDNESFEIMWRTTVENLIALGLSETEINNATNQFSKITLQDCEDEENKKKVQLLKDEANLYFQNKKFRQAIVKYSEAIRQSGNNPTKELAILYSNRSIAFLKCDDYYRAKSDARGAILIQPTWCKGHARLGQAYEFAEKYEKALSCFDAALKLEPSNAGLKNERDSCRHMVAKQERVEHLDPHNYVESFEECAEKYTKQYGGSISKHANQSKVAQKANFEMGLPIGICGEGHNYLVGRGVQQNFETAAKYYAKAAKLGSAEGIYNLAKLTMEGKGVRRNVPEAVRLYRLAASQKITTNSLESEIAKIGVGPAEHALGMCYVDGVGVPQDYKIAMEWYTKALQHGVGQSANNIGTMYSIGQGVEPDIEKAIQYQKLSAFMKVIRAMENLAHQYYDIFDFENAEKWYRFAICKGSLALQSEPRFKIFRGTKPFEEDIFELELIEEVKNGPLQHFITEDLCKKLHSLTQTLIPNDTGKSMTSRKELGLSDPYRLHLIEMHRNDFKDMRKSEHKNAKYEKGNANLQPKPMIDLFSLKPIYFQDMDPLKDHIYEGFAIKLTFIEDAVLGRPSIYQLIEDEKGDAQRIFIYNFPQNKETQNSLGFGCKITLVNPYFRLAKDGGAAIRVDDTSLMFLHSTLSDKTRCRYCGQQNVKTVPCRTCKRAFYCSKLCLKKDIELNHRYVCVKHL